jgi:hypothetical protein
VGNAEGQTVARRAWKLGGPALLACLLVFGSGTRAALAAPAAVVGLSDQRPASLTDPLFQSLNMQVARVAVPWDVALTDTTQLDVWLAAARTGGLTPMIAFTHGEGERCPEGPCRLPSLAEFTAAFEAFHARYPGIRTFTVWNEANHPSQPTAAHPELAADFYDAMVERCEGCRIVAADVLDDGSMESWTQRFRARTTNDPRLWGLHNYGDLTRGETLRTRRFLDLVPGEVWLTEVNAIIRLEPIWTFDESRGPRGIRILRFLTDELPQRLTRVYLYHWREGHFIGFDSALTRKDGSARPALEVLGSWLELPPEARAQIAAAAALGPEPEGEAAAERAHRVRIEDDTNDPPRLNRRLTRFGVIDLRARVRCPRKRVTSCRGSVVIQPRRPARPFRTLATKGFAIRRGTSRQVRLVLPREWQARRACRARRQLLVGLTDGDGVPTSETVLTVPAARGGRCAAGKSRRSRGSATSTRAAHALHG